MTIISPSIRIHSPADSPPLPAIRWQSRWKTERILTRLWIKSMWGAATMSIRYLRMNWRRSLDSTCTSGTSPARAPWSTSSNMLFKRAKPLELSMAHASAPAMKNSANAPKASTQQTRNLWLKAMNILKRRKKKRQRSNICRNKRRK